MKWYLDVLIQALNYFVTCTYINNYILYNIRYIYLFIKKMEVVNPITRCLGTTKKGMRCRRNITNKYCRFHIPETITDIPDECAICFDDITNEDSALECGHIFHKKCISIMKNTNCPLCRFKSQIIEFHQTRIKIRLNAIINKIFHEKEFIEHIITKNNWVNNNDSTLISHIIIIKNMNCCKSIILREIINHRTDKEILNIIMAELKNKIIIENYSGLFNVC